MKNRMKIKTNPKRKDFSFVRFFNPQKSPHTTITIDHQGNPRIEYLAKNRKRKGILAWSSTMQGTYVTRKHGILKSAKRVA